MTGLRTVFLLTLLTLVLVGAAGLMGFGRTGMIVALGIGLALNLFNYWFSAPMILKAYRAQIIEPGSAEAAEYAWMLDDVREMTSRAGLPMPRVALIPNQAPNAFATGRNPQNAVVAATTGLLSILDRRQVRAVLGHELGHVRNRDMLTMTLVAGAVSAIGMLTMMAQFGMYSGRGQGDRRGANPILMLLIVIFAPLMARLVAMAISRSREYAADAEGAGLSGDPKALAEALARLHQAIPHAPPLTQSGATAHMMIANPFTGHSLGRLFSTHPDPQDRIDRLMAMAAAG